MLQEPFLRRLLQLHGAAVEIRRRDFLEGTWAPFLVHAASLDVAYECAASLSRLCMHFSLHENCNDWCRMWQDASKKGDSGIAGAVCCLGTQSAGEPCIAGHHGCL